MTDLLSLLVADASVLVNLVATGRAEDHLRVLDQRMVMTEVVLREIESGQSKGRTTTPELRRLVSIGLIEVVNHSPDHDEVFLSLVVGSAATTLDDGEAATLAYAVGRKSIAVIDERKAVNISKQRFPNLTIRSTTDLLLGQMTFQALGETAAIDSIFSALSNARMRVPEHHLARIVALLGPERARLCPSLPMSFRE